MFADGPRAISPRSSRSTTTRITLDSDVRDDLDADSLALIELVEALEEELGERTVGFTVDDEDLGDLQTVRDAVDYVVPGCGDVLERLEAWPDGRTPHGSTVEWPLGACRRPGTRRAAAARAGLEFTDHALLDRALTHRSFCAEHGIEESNERLEFLGDAVLGFVVTDYVFEQYPQLPEGELAKVRAVGRERRGARRGRGRSSTSARRLRLGKGEDASVGAAKPSILADAMEAVIAAVYLDGGLEPAARLVLAAARRRASASRRPARAATTTRRGSRSSRRSGSTSCPRYQVRDEGPDHAKRFFATVLLRGEPYGTGEGRSKKQAEQAAHAPLALGTAAGRGEQRLRRPGGPIGVGDAGAT